jgi:hypothetical protein
MPKKIPKFLEKYFWDTDCRAISLDVNRQYILKKILEYGDEKAVAWMRKHFKAAEIKKNLACCRGYSAKSANYWALVYDIPKDEVLCLKKRWSRAPKTFWPH